MATQMKTSGVIKLQYLSKGKLEQARELRKNMPSAEKRVLKEIRFSNKQIETALETVITHIKSLLLKVTAI